MTNQPSHVPGVGTGAFVGTLRCVKLTPDRSESLAGNALVGLATIERSADTPASHIDAAQYRALGIRALPQGPDGDGSLRLGGFRAEYEACPVYHVLSHFFDGAPVSDGDSSAEASTTLVLTSCGAGLPQAPGDIVQFLSYNEFAQRFSTSRFIGFGQLVSPLSQIDARPENANRSIFWHQVTGTLTGRTQIRGIRGGLHAVAIESHREPANPANAHSDAINAHSFGARPEGDVVAFAPECIGDCGLDGSTTVDDLVTGVQVVLGVVSIDACASLDSDGDLAATVDELVAAVRVALDGCTPQPRAPAPPLAFTPRAVTSEGPEITHLGLATADDRPLLPSAVDDEGRAVFVRPFGQGMTVVVEARPGVSGRRVGSSTHSPQGQTPDLQVLVSRPLGDGDATVCEADGRGGGIPAVPSLDFAPDPTTVAAINDLGCRAVSRRALSGTTFCTRNPFEVASGQPFIAVSRESPAQFCIPIARAWAFPVGDTIVAARVRDDAGNLGPVREMVVRVLE
jgi:hypothetical protein